ncbi:MAG TPA: hypothetical protein VGB75_02935 [Jatrophihabitans sp.]|jgi:hypothetical protein|uniref:hypothetical protein n=1 Tax=Jatrophihabitans sp. TaxID=1932789 RepID=UPI002F10B8A6
MTERTRSRSSTVAAIVAPGAAALLSAATAFALHHSPEPAAKASPVKPVKAATPATGADDAAVARLRRQSTTADAELKRLRAQLAQVNSELAKAAAAPIELPRVDPAGPPVEVLPAAPGPAAAPPPAAPPAPAPPPPPVDASTGAS